VDVVHVLGFKKNFIADVRDGCFAGAGAGVRGEISGHWQAGLKSITSAL